MKTYTLKLKTTSTTNYNLYDGTTLVSDTDLGTLFGSAGEAYFTFDFNSLTPTNTTSLTILDSQDTAVITNTGLSGIAEDKNFKGTWSASATAFDSFTLLTGVAMDEAQLGKLAGMIKDGGVKTLTTADYNYPTNNPPTQIALWLLDNGVYIVSANLNVATSTSNLNVELLAGAVIIKSGYTITVHQKGTFGNDSAYDIGYWLTSDSTGVPVSPGLNAGTIDNSIITGYRVADSLTISSSKKRVLDAHQGKVLNERIGDLTTLTTTAKTSTVAAINELDSEIPVITMTSTDPGEGVALAANHFVAYYE